jgi:hypothetical protein
MRAKEALNALMRGLSLRNTNSNGTIDPNGSKIFLSEYVIEIQQSDGTVFTLVDFKKYKSGGIS